MKYVSCFSCYCVYLGLENGRQALSSCYLQDFFSYLPLYNLICRPWDWCIIPMFAPRDWWKSPKTSCNLRAFDGEWNRRISWMRARCIICLCLIFTTVKLSGVWSSESGFLMFEIFDVPVSVRLHVSLSCNSCSFVARRIDLAWLLFYISTKYHRNWKVYPCRGIEKVNFIYAWSLGSEVN